MSTWKRIESSKSDNGLAKVTVGESRFKIERLKDGAVVWEGKFDRSAWPENAPAINSVPKGTIMFVALTADKLTVQAIRPANEVLHVRVRDFVRPEEGADPTPKTYHVTPQKGQPYDYQAFNVLLEVVGNPDLATVEIPSFTRYNIQNIDGYAGLRGRADNRHTNRLADFLNLTGVDQAPIAWPDDGNILPELLRRIKKAGKVFRVILKDGYVDGYMAPDAVFMASLESTLTAPAEGQPAPASKNDEDDL